MLVHEQISCQGYLFCCFLKISFTRLDEKPTHDTKQPTGAYCILANKCMLCHLIWLHSLCNCAFLFSISERKHVLKQHRCSWCCGILARMLKVWDQETDVICIPEQIGPQYELTVLVRYQSLLHVCIGSPYYFHYSFSYSKLKHCHL